MAFDTALDLPCEGWKFGCWDDRVHAVEVLIFMPSEKRYVVKQNGQVDVVCEADLFSDQKEALRRAFERYVERSSDAMNKAQQFRIDAYNLELGKTAK
jgi:hypothetical protein